MRAPTVLAAAAAAALVGAALAGCTTGPGTPSPTPTPSAPETIAPGNEVLPTAAPQLRPGGSADQNKMYWDAAILDYWDRFRLGSTQTMVDQLRNWGFDPAATEITYDSTAIGLGVESIEVAVRFGEECLLADVRGDRYNTVILPVLGTGKCLVGETHPVG